MSKDAIVRKVLCKLSNWNYYKNLSLSDLNDKYEDAAKSLSESKIQSEKAKWTKELAILKTEFKMRGTKPKSP